LPCTIGPYFFFAKVANVWALPLGPDDCRRVLPFFFTGECPCPLLVPVVFSAFFLFLVDEFLHPIPLRPLLQASVWFPVDEDGSSYSLLPPPSNRELTFAPLVSDWDVFYTLVHDQFGPLPQNATKSDFRPVGGPKTSSSLWFRCPLAWLFWWQSFPWRLSRPPHVARFPVTILHISGAFFFPSSCVVAFFPFFVLPELKASFSPTGP